MAEMAGGAHVDSVTGDDVTALAVGAALIGCGGGGTTLLGGMLCRAALEPRPVPIVAAEQLAPRDFVIHVGAVGAPDIFAEQMIAPTDLARAVEALARNVGVTPVAIGVIEIGGLNALIPVVAAAALGLPVVDGDLMGRAFPSVCKTVLAARGAAITPYALVGATGSVVVVESGSDTSAESVILAAVDAMGGSAALAMFPTTAGDLRSAACGGSLSTCIRLGRAYLEHRDDPLPVLADGLGGTVVFDGWVAEVRPRGRDTPGAVTMLSADGTTTCRVDFHDELLRVSRDGVPVAATPAIIIALQSTTGTVLQVDDFALGQGVSIVTLPALHRWPEQAGGTVGPAAFGLGEEVPR